MSAPILAYQATGRGNLADPLNLVLNPRGSVGYGSDTLLAYIEGYQLHQAHHRPVQGGGRAGARHPRGRAPLPRRPRGREPGHPALARQRVARRAPAGRSGKGRPSAKVSALVSFTQAWVVTNFDEMLDLLRYFGHDDEVSAMRKAPESERARHVARVLRGHRPQQRHARERGAQPVLQPHRPGQPALHRRGRPRLAHRSGRGLHQPRPARRGRSRTPPAPRPTGSSAGAYINLRLELFFRDESGFGRLRLLPASRADYERTLAAGPAPGEA